MNRRNYLKNFFFLGGLTILPLSIYEWLEVNNPLSENVFLSKKAIISELVELIIPVTDTPGAKAAHVEDYVIRVMSNCNNARQQHIFLSGIENLENITSQTLGRTFIECTLLEKQRLLENISKKEGSNSNFFTKVKVKFWGQSFFSKLRDLTVEGYCISLLGSTQGLAYDYIPVSYESCVMLKPKQKTWATK